MVLSAAGFAVMGALVKLAGQAGIPLLQIIAVRAVVSLLLSLADTYRAGIPPLGKRRGLLLMRGVVGFVALTGVYYSMLHLPYAEATILQYTHPVFTALLAFVFLSEVPRPATLACVLLSLAGLAVLMLPNLTGAGFARLPTVAIAAGLVGALGSGVAYTIVRKLAGSEHPAVIVMYFPLVCLPATVLLGGSEFVWPDPATWLVLLGVGVFTQLGQIAMTRAMAVDTASRNTSLSYIQIVFAAALGAIVFGELPSAYTVGAAGCIVAGATVNLWGGRSAAPTRQGR